jgi:hypothetical protein
MSTIHMSLWIVKVNDATKHYHDGSYMCSNFSNFLTPSTNRDSAAPVNCKVFKRGGREEGIDMLQEDLSNDEK